jgi:hypothetical protein
MILAVFASDTHIGSAVGLLTRAVPMDDGGTRTPSPAQDWLAECWASLWQTVDDERRKHGARVVSCLVGDVVDINSKTAFQLISENPDTILDAAEAALEDVRLVSDAIHICRGTEVHTGGSGWMEERLARAVLGKPEPGEGPRSRYHLRMDLDGVRFDVCHHPVTYSGIPWYQQAALNRQAARVWTDYHRMGEKPPDCVIRAHAHFCPSEPGAFDETLCWFLPPWQLTTNYGFRRGAGSWIEPPGALLVYCEEGRYTWRMLRYKPAIAPAWRL